MARKKDQWDGSERRTAATVLVAGEAAPRNELLKRVMEARGFQVSTAITANEAIATVSDQLPRVIVLDLSPTGVGASMQVLDAVRQHEDDRVRNVRVVISARSAANRTFAFQSGADGFLLRPFHADDLVDLIGQVLAVAPEDRATHRRTMLDQIGARR